MAVSRALRRLLQVLDLEEEQRKLALESALGELRRLQDALVSAGNRDRRGRHLVRASTAPSDPPGRIRGAIYNQVHDQMIDRIAGLAETRAAMRCVAALKPRIAEAEDNVADLREEFLAKRIERRQAETLIEQAEARDAVEAARRGQQSLDDWYLNRFRGRDSGEDREAEPRVDCGPDREAESVPEPPPTAGSGRAQRRAAEHAAANNET